MFLLIINKNGYKKGCTSIDKYKIVLSVLCGYYGISIDELNSLLKKQENKYLLLLLSKEFKCFDEEKLKEDLRVRSKITIKNNLKKAEEKLLINKEFRNDYFYLEEKIQENF